jgi:hypothetical protein
MKRLLTACLAAALAPALASAAPADDASAAARKLAAAANYSWTRTTEIPNSQFPAMPVEGQTEKSGYTVTTVTFNENSFKTISKDGRSVSQGQDGRWLTAEERREQFAAKGGGGGGGTKGGTGRGGGRGGFGFLGGGSQLTPAEEVVALAARIKDAKLVDGAIVGNLSPEDVAARLTFGGRGGRGGDAGQTPPAPKNASGSVKFWLKDGAIARYVVTVKGTIAIPNGEERDVERTTTTEIKNIGSTKVTVPDEAKNKLGV